VLPRGHPEYGDTSRPSVVVRPREGLNLFSESSRRMARWVQPGPTQQEAPWTRLSVLPLVQSWVSNMPSVSRLWSETVFLRLTECDAHISTGNAASPKRAAHVAEGEFA
jgi:hypothetical protein